MEEEEEMKNNRRKSRFTPAERSQIKVHLTDTFLTSHNYVEQDDGFCERFPLAALFSRQLYAVYLLTAMAVKIINTVQIRQHNSLTSR
jgi:hypothetical protein